MPDESDKLRNELEGINRSLQEQIRATRDTAKTANETWKEIPARISELHVPRDVHTKEQSDRDKAHRQQVWLTWGTWLAFIAAAIYAGIAARQLKEMKSSTGLMRDTLTETQKSNALLTAQLKGSEAAFVSVVVEVGNQVGNFDRPFNQIYLIVQNSGHAIATNIRVHSSMQLVSLEGRPISKEYVFDYSMAALDFKSGDSGDQRRFFWDDDAHAAQSLESIKALKMTARKQWVFEYGNGFGDTIKSESFCQELLVNDWVSCHDFPIRLRSLKQETSH